jgi:hypothetical protein
MNTGVAVPTRARPHHNSLIGVKCPDDGPMRRLMRLGRRCSRGATGEGQFDETLVSIGWATVAAATLALAGFNGTTNAASWLVAYRPFQSTPDLPDSSLRHSS